METVYGDLRIIDSHAHFFSRRFFESYLKRRGRDLKGRNVIEELGWEMPDEDPVKLGERWVGELDRYGIDRIVLFSGIMDDEESISKAVRTFPERLIGYDRIDPLQEGARERVRRSIMELGLKGIKMFPSMECFHAYDERVYPVYEEAERLDVPVIMHFGLLKSAIRAFLNLPSLSDTRYANPIDLQVPARDFPKLNFIIPHFGTGYLRETLLVVAHCPENVYIDTSSSNAWIKYSPYPVDLKGVFERTLQAVGPERIIFGTDSSWFPRGFRADILQNQLEVLKSLNVPKEDVQLIMGGNIARLLGLD